MNKGEILSLVNSQMSNGKTLIEAIIFVAKILHHEEPVDPVVYYQQLIGGE